jgi:hypothetical protein
MWMACQNALINTKTIKKNRKGMSRSHDTSVLNNLITFPRLFVYRENINLKKIRHLLIVYFLVSLVS